jgi:hypothetical protein
MILFLHEDLANLFRHRVFSKRFTLPDAIAVIANGFIFIFEIIRARASSLRLLIDLTD